MLLIKAIRKKERKLLLLLRRTSSSYSRGLKKRKASFARFARKKRLLHDSVSDVYSGVDRYMGVSCNTVIYKINEDGSVVLRMEEQPLFRYSGVSSESVNNSVPLQAVLELNCGVSDSWCSNDLIYKLTKIFGFLKVVNIVSVSRKHFKLDTTGKPSNVMLKMNQL